MFATHRSAFRRFVAVALVASTLAGCESKPPAPGQAEFDSANAKITVYESQVGFGNDAAAKKAADAFAKRLKAFEADNFSGGKDMNTATTGGNWMTYCNASGGKATFLVRVPNLETYEGEDRELLVDLAWTAANEASASLKPSTITVGLRGKLLYGGYATGSAGPKPKTRKTGTALDTAPFYADFAAKK